MMWIYREDGSSSFSCPDDQTLFRHIMDIENAKLLEGHPQFGQSSWSFTHYPPRRVVDLYAHTPVLSRTFCLNQAFERSLGLIEVYKGDIFHPIEMVATDDLDIQALKKQWCLDYCKAHHYKVFEAPQPFPLPSPAPKSQDKGRGGGQTLEGSLSQKQPKNSLQEFPSGPQGKIVYSS